MNGRIIIIIIIIIITVKCISKLLNFLC